MKILVVPDSLWGDLSGHRSAKYLIKAFSALNINIAVYASIINLTNKQNNEIKKHNCKFYPKLEYKYTQQIFNKNAYQEFQNVVNDFKPDYVFYFGTIKNKITIDYCLKNKIKYFYLPLTNEYYCIKHYAGLKNAPCYQCLHGSLIAPILNKCKPSNDYNFLKYVKDKTIELKSHKRIVNATKILGYSQNQLDTLIEYGVNKDKTVKLPIFFNPETSNGIKPKKGEKFLITGQFLSEKGLNLIPEMIKKTTKVKFKAIIGKNISDQIIKNYNLEIFVNDGRLEIIDYLETHELFLKELSVAKGVLIPSYYPTTGEFTMVESLMFSKPVVVFNSGIHKEVFVNRKNGMVSNVNNLDHYFNNIQELNNDDDLLKTVSSGAKELFNELTSFDRFKNDVKKLFN